MEHVPVLLKECLDGLNIKQDGIYVDGTLGRAGHSIEIVKRLEKGRLIGIDKDMAAIEEAGRNLAAFGERVTLVRGDFREIGNILDGLGIEKADGMLFDLGVSSPQLDDAGRGFSYTSDAPLDMRMNRNAALSAFDIVNEWTERELKRIFYEYGEERYAPRIAAEIIKKRGIKRIESTLELAEIIRGAMPPKALREKQHPAKRTFQAIRIAVNDELGAIKDMLHIAPDRLNIKGRLCVISFHSLEDRLVKNAFVLRENGCKCPKDFPVCICGFVPTMKTITKKPIAPGKDETERNPRSRSARLRIAERV